MTILNLEKQQSSAGKTGMTVDGKAQEDKASTVKEEREESYESYYDEEEDADADPNEFAISKAKGAHFKGTIKNARASVAH